MSTPFTPGRRYRVRAAFKALRDSFEGGEILIFDSQAWSRYDGITGYFFRQPDRKGLRMWDIADEEDISIWKTLFEELPENNVSVD
ncbi:MAG TPA: hypothetical protein VGE39_18390 [Prosthecobacter sp.]